MKIEYKLGNVCIISSEDYIFSNVQDRETWQILKDNLSSEKFLELKEKKYENEDYEFLDQLSKDMELPFKDYWSKAIELLSNGKFRDSKIDNQSFPIYEFKEILVSGKSWKKEFGDELMSIWMDYHLGF